jgi:hypothetical protein
MNRNLCFALAEGIGVFIGFIVNAAFDIADGLVFKLTFNVCGDFTIRPNLPLSKLSLARVRILASVEAPLILVLVTDSS